MFIISLPMWGALLDHYEDRLRSAISAGKSIGELQFLEEQVSLYRFRYYHYFCH